MGEPDEGAHWVTLTNNNVEIMINHDHDMGGVHALPYSYPFEKPIDGFERHNVGATEKGLSIRALMAHEHGHAIHSFVKRNCLGLAVLFTEPKLYQECQKANDELVAAYKQAQRDGSIKKLSMYGNSDPNEFFAECFAARVLGEDLPDYVNSALDNIIKIGTKKS